MTVAELDRAPRPLAAFAPRIGAEGTSTVPALYGEADVSTLPTVVDALARAISEHDGDVVVDLAKTSFIDTATLSALGRAAQFLASRDRTLTVRRPSQLTLRVLAFLGVSDLIQIETPQHERRPGALAAAKAAATAEREHPVYIGLGAIVLTSSSSCCS